jgi:hypothetical protein
VGLELAQYRGSRLLEIMEKRQLCSTQCTTQISQYLWWTNHNRWTKQLSFPRRSVSSSYYSLILMCRPLHSASIIQQSKLIARWVRQECKRNHKEISTVWIWRWVEFSDEYYGASWKLRPVAIRAYAFITAIFAEKLAVTTQLIPRSIWLGLENKRKYWSLLSALDGLESV